MGDIFIKLILGNVSECVNVRTISHPIQKTAGMDVSERLIGGYNSYNSTFECTMTDAHVHLQMQALAKRK